MKYNTFEDNVCCNNGGKLYRDCLLVNLKTFQIQDHLDGFAYDQKDLIISDEDIPEDCIVVDALMAPIILELNRKGYKTIYSCQGHFDKDIYDGEDGEKYSGVTSTYVIFEAGPHLDRYINNLLDIPRQFEVRIDNGELADNRSEELERTYGVHRDKGSNKRIAIYSSMPYIYTDDMEIDYDKIDPEMFNKYNRSDLMMLAAWVGGLPDLTEEPIEKSNALYDERIIDKDTARQCGFDFESVQEFASDIKDCYDVMAESINEINHEMSILNDMVESISVRLSSLKVVEDIRDIDDTSMHESCVIEESFPKKDNYKDLVKYLNDLKHHPLKDYDNKSKYDTPISPEEIKKLGEEYFNTRLHVKNLVNEVYDESCDKRRKEFFDGIMNHKTK